MKSPNAARPTTRFERAKPWIVIGTILLILIGVTGFLKFDGIQLSETTFDLVVNLGVVTIVLIFITFFYSLRKRNFQERTPGSMMAWLQVHVYIGLLSLVVVFFHIWVPSFSEGWTSGKYALAVFALLVISGAAWRIVYSVIPPRVAGDVGNLSTFDTKDKARIARVEIDKLLAGKSVEFQRAAQNRLSGRTVEKKSPSIPAAEASDWDRLNKLADRSDRYASREVRQTRYAFFLQAWKRLHIPLSIVLIGLIAVHVWDTLHVPNAISKGELRGLPPASSCADCHAAIVEEWNLAMHSQAQNAPVIIAQTNLALEKYPEFGLACNNCHAPIGTALTDIPTLPLDEGDSLRSQPNGAVMDDGVTCVVCHTLAEAPHERRGMENDFPFVEGEPNQFAQMFGPPLDGPLPSTRHGSQTGFMTDSVASSQLCGACHNVKVDMDDKEITAFPGSDGNNQDLDGDRQLDENELEFNSDGKTLQDLVLQTTFDEWEDYVAFQRASGRGALGCVDCHMPVLTPEPLVASSPGSLFADAPDRARHSHSFVGVDYNLAPDHYAEGELEHVLEERAALLNSAMTLSINLFQPGPKNNLSATVIVTSNLEGHNLPTGFAFARQMWLEVSAETSTGQPVCLANKLLNGQFILANCVSGTLVSPQADLVTCDPLELAQLGLKPSKNDELVQLHPDSIAPLTNCDPWLTNFQKILTDGDSDGDGIFTEVAYQSLQADIVKTRVRTSDQQAMDALNNTILVNGEPHDAASYEYIFDLTGFEGEDIIVTAVMHFRHLPPYFIRELDGGYPNGLTASDLLENLTVTDVEKITSDPFRAP